jgi:hypothetical protein
MRGPLCPAGDVGAGSQWGNMLLSLGPMGRGLLTNEHMRGPLCPAGDVGAGSQWGNVLLSLGPMGRGLTHQ